MSCDIIPGSAGPEPGHPRETKCPHLPDIVKFAKNPDFFGSAKQSQFERHFSECTFCERQYKIAWRRSHDGLKFGTFLRSVAPQLIQRAGVSLDQCKDFPAAKEPDEDDYSQRPHEERAEFSETLEVVNRTVGPPAMGTELRLVMEVLDGLQKQIEALVAEVRSQLEVVGSLRAGGNIVYPFHGGSGQPPRPNRSLGRSLLKAAAVLLVALPVGSYVIAEQDRKDDQDRKMDAVIAATEATNKTVDRLARPVVRGFNEPDDALVAPESLPTRRGPVLANFDTPLGDLSPGRLHTFRDERQEPEAQYIEEYWDQLSIAKGRLAGFRVYPYNVDAGHVGIVLHVNNPSWAIYKDGVLVFRLRRLDPGHDRIERLAHVGGPDSFAARRYKVEVTYQGESGSRKAAVEVAVTTAMEERQATSGFFDLAVPVADLVKKGLDLTRPVQSVQLVIDGARLDPDDDEYRGAIGLRSVLILPRRDANVDELLERPVRSFAGDSDFDESKYPRLDGPVLGDFETPMGGLAGGQCGIYSDTTPPPSELYLERYWTHFRRPDGSREGLLVLPYNVTKGWAALEVRTNQANWKDYGPDAELVLRLRRLVPGIDRIIRTADVGGPDTEAVTSMGIEVCVADAQGDDGPYYRAVATVTDAMKAQQEREGWFDLVVPLKALVSDVGGEQEHLDLNRPIKKLAIILTGPEGHPDFLRLGCHAPSEEQRGALGVRAIAIASRPGTDVNALLAAPPPSR